MYYRLCTPIRSCRGGPLLVQARVGVGYGGYWLLINPYLGSRGVTIISSSQIDTTKKTKADLPERICPLQQQQQGHGGTTIIPLLLRSPVLASHPQTTSIDRMQRSNGSNHVFLLSRLICRRTRLTRSGLASLWICMHLGSGISFSPLGGVTKDGWTYFDMLPYI